MASVARSVLVFGTATSPSNAIHILVTFRRVFRKINTCSKTQTNWSHHPNLFLLDFFFLFKKGLGTAVQHKHTCTKHASNVGVSLIKAVMHYVMDEGRAVEEHPLVGMVVVALGHLASPIHIPLPHLGVDHSLNLRTQRVVYQSWQKTSEGKRDRS